MLADWVDIRQPLSHLYFDNGTFTLALTVRDPKNATDTKTTTVTIANVAPTILEGSLTGPSAPIPLTGGSASPAISFEFSDPAGTHDVYAVTTPLEGGNIRIR